MISLAPNLTGSSAAILCQQKALMPWVTGSEHLQQALEQDLFPLKISTMREGSVYYHPNLGVVAKRRKTNPRGGKTCNVCVEREYDVGLLANQYETPYLVRTLGYYERRSKQKVVSVIVTSYVPGRTLYQMLQAGNVAPAIFVQVLYTLRHLQDLMDFVHYDIHANNIIITELRQPRLHSFRFDGQDYQLKSPYQVTFIDLARSYVRGIWSCYAEVNFICSAVTPGLFDPLIDLAAYSAILLQTFGSNPAVLALLEGNRFSHYTTEEVEDNELYLQLGYPIISDDYPVVELVKSGKFWAQVEKHYEQTDSISEVFREYAVAKLALVGLDPYDEDDQRYQKLEAHALGQAGANDEYPEISSANALRVYVPKEVKDSYRKRLGEAIAKEASVRIDNYEDSAESFTTELLSYLRHQLPTLRL